MKAAYLIVLFVSLLAGLKFPDTDLILIFILDHRSIITHGIIVPYFLYKYLTKKVKSEFLDYAYIGFFDWYSNSSLRRFISKSIYRICND